MSNDDKVAAETANAIAALEELEAVLSHLRQGVADWRRRALKAEAETALADYEKTIAEATAKAQESVRDAAREMAEDAERQREALATRLAEQLSAAEQRIADEKARAIGDIGDIAGELTQAAASRLIGSEVGQDEANAAVASVMRESA